MPDGGTRTAPHGDPLAAAGAGATGGFDDALIHLERPGTLTAFCGGPLVEIEVAGVPITPDLCGVCIAMAEAWKGRRIAGFGSDGRVVWL